MPSLSATNPSRSIIRRSIAKPPFTSPFGPCLINLSISSFEFMMSGSTIFFTIAPRLGGGMVFGMFVADKSLFALVRVLNRCCESVYVVGTYGAAESRRLAELRCCRRC